ncbi:hypothetical protein ACET3Z_010778 [Daucus carota]
MVDAAKRGWRDRNGLFTKVHPTHKSYRMDTLGDYDDLRIAVGNGTTIEKNAIGLGDDTDARTYDNDASKKHQPLDDLVYDYNIEAYTLVDFQDPLAQPSESINLDVHPPPTLKKRNRPV